MVKKTIDCIRLRSFGASARPARWAGNIHALYNRMLWDDLLAAPYKRRARGTPDTKIRSRIADRAEFGCANPTSTRSEIRNRNRFPGGHRRRVTPVPIPNTEVKPATADGTACVGVWESRSLPGLFPKPLQVEAAFPLYGRTQLQDRLEDPHSNPTRDVERTARFVPPVSVSP